MGRCVIVGGSDIGNYDLIREELRDDDFIVYCDSGLVHMDVLKAKPNLIVGDFDSHENPHLEIETIVLPREKDDTDTVYAVREALRRGFGEFLLVGVTGRRLDHTIGNLSILLWLDASGRKGRIIDDWSEIEVVSEAPVFIGEEYAYFSLLNISGTAKGIRIRNAKYPLEDGEITCEYQYGISNEVLPGKVAEVSVGVGKALLVKCRKDPI